MVDKLNSEISRILEVLDKYRGKGVLSEANTKSSLVEPVLRTLGWNVFDFEEVDKEWKVFDGTSVDYALKISGKPRIFIEAKALDISLDDPKLIGQTIKYTALEKDLRWCVLTNGNEYRLYKSDEIKLNPENRIVFTVSISECKDNDKRAFFIEMMKRLSRNSLESGEFNKWADELFIENRIRRIMQNPSDEFLSIVREQIGIITASDEQIKQTMKNILKKDVERTSEQTIKDISKEDIEPTPMLDKEDKRSIKYQLNQASHPLKELFGKVENSILSLGNDVQKEERKSYYAYYRNTKFVCLEIRRTIETILIYLNIDPNTLETIPEIARSMTGMWHFSTVYLELRIRTSDDFEVAKPLIQKSYEVN
ncbi:hypothetical protein FJZ31_33225 [Candidatus Poribacteria bacterium]|nr:hypothetical protein [Candidatus Poribacteria bacterium]